ncbi:right-handed parallel beta-helix repeat-containing protein [Sulfurisphaera ohwakuensis]|uniref:Parallel beta-helix repeat protein n=1 Tax=Sulfurisphaera ohwakuensis TaxID=69656 RepID=A0A650CG16_SULOH|nr:right-handed parallel beta-helix repeat-containing protein [Sulfurisphaera ohwakuensis]MBB5254477.1 parallel beta-helix repeat protein [Sulfurisphaera ohwakuensis]QGR16719.1 right-handed parallel beta-helix repeat-containing protein [Sulfurisphaera ohwakuensis]
MRLRGLLLILFIVILLLNFTSHASLYEINHSLMIINKKNLVISGINVINGNITIINSSNIIIKDDSIYNGSYFGIFVYNSKNVTIENNHIDRSYYDGISIRKSQNVTIENNIIANNSNGNGISVWDNSNHIIIANNILSNNGYGIFILMSSNVTMLNNSIVKTYYYAIYLYQANFIKIINNTILLSDIGLEIEYGSYIQLEFNVIKNDLVGVYLGDGIGSLNLINNIIQNSRYFGVLIKYYPNIFNYNKNTFINNTANIFYEFNNTLPEQTNGLVPPITITSKSNILFNYSYLTILLLVIPVIYLLRRRRK